MAEKQKPGNPFAEGAESSVDAQKIALTQMLAEQGARGAQVVQNRGQDAQALAAMQQQQYGGQPSSLYQTFDRDAQQMAQAQANEQARTASANQFYMDQVKAAIPIHQADTDAYYEALRKEYEDRQAERAQAMALARSRGGGGGGGGGGGRGGGGGPQLSGSPRSLQAAAAAVGISAGDVDKWWGPKAKGKAATLRDGIDIGIYDHLNNGDPWELVVAEARAGARQLGLDFNTYAQPLLAQYSPLWGVDDSWIAPPQNRGQLVGSAVGNVLDKNPWIKNMAKAVQSSKGKKKK